MRKYRIVGCGCFNSLRWLQLSVIWWLTDGTNIIHFLKGTRMWRRGADPDGYVANFVESEQIMQFNGYTASFVQVLLCMSMTCNSYMVDLPCKI